MKRMQAPVVGIVLMVCSTLAGCGSESTESTATEPAATEPAATEPPATEPAATEPAATEPAATEPAATEPAATEPAATEPAVTEPEAEAEVGAFCEALAVLDEGSIDLSSDPVTLEAGLSDLLEEFDEVIAIAPADVRGFIEGLRSYQRAFYGVLDQYDFDFEAASVTPEYDAVGELLQVQLDDLASQDRITELCGL